MLGYRLLATTLQLCLPLATNAQTKPAYFERGVPIEFNDFVSCSSFSSAVTVLRRAHDASVDRRFTGFQLTESDDCVRIGINNARTGSQIVVLYTLTTFKTSDQAGDVTQLHIHGYRRALWTADRLEYMVTQTPLQIR